MAKQALSLPRGTKDITPEDINYWHHVENISRGIFELYNYEEMRTPIFESTEVFERGIGDTTDIVEKEMYTFEDKGGRRLTLRPEGTAPIVRAYIQNGFFKKQKNLKVYYCGPMFRYERPQAGRYRQFHQIGIEYIGNEHAFSDAEVISLAIHLFDELGLTGLSVKINSVGCGVCRTVIEERLKQFIGMNLKNLCGDCKNRFEKRPLRILDCKNKKCQTYFSGLPDNRKSLCQECADHFNLVVEYMDSLKIPFKIDPLQVRGLDYYTKTTFEVISKELGAQNALCGGGRYNNLVERSGGPPTPAVGFAIGMERAVMVLKEYSDILRKKETLTFVAPIGLAQEATCFYIMDELRRAGIKCEMNFAKKDLKSQLKHANKINADYTIIYGAEEAEKKVVLYKDMNERTQKELKLENLTQQIKDELKI
jgi:histidyl-tRNA synthetase